MSGAPMFPKWITAVFVVLGMKPMLTNSAMPSVTSIMTNPFDPDLYYNTMELICVEGYPVQQHKVTTRDGYILTMHRIPNGNRKERVKERGRGYTSYHHHVHPAFYQCMNDSMWERGSGPPVILQHGFIAASDWWVLQGAGKDLAYLLADAGYDVWLGNARGNYYSRSHVYLSTGSKEFWDFSYHEIGTYDLPAMIDYVLKETGHKQVYYVGHSMGTLQALILGSARPEYMKKIRLATLLAPVGNLSESFKLGLKTLVPRIISGTANAMKYTGRYEFLPRQNLNVLMLNRVCNASPLLLDVCYDIGIGLDGHTVYNLERRTFSRMITHVVSGTSPKIVEHAIQLLHTKQLREFDYGPEKNYRIYNQATPRQYNVWRVTCPMALFYSDSDFFVDVEHVHILEKQLPNVVYSKLVPKMLHTDLIFARNAKEKVYDDMLKLMTKY